MKYKIKCLTSNVEIEFKPSFIVKPIDNTFICSLITDTSIGGFKIIDINSEFYMLFHRLFIEKKEDYKISQEFLDCVIVISKEIIQEQKDRQKKMEEIKPEEIVNLILCKK